ncbi:MAG: RNA polymerase sigma factor [Janthinobacterium lividum]
MDSRIAAFASGWVDDMRPNTVEWSVDKERPTYFMGKDEQFAEECERWRSMLFKVAVRQTRSHDNAEDFVQQTYLKAWNARGTFKGDARLSTWLVRILMNEIYQKFRKADERRLEFTDNLSMFDFVQGRSDFRRPDPSAEVEMLRHEKHVLLYRAVCALPYRYRSVMLLEIFEEKSEKEVCRELSLTPSALKTRRMRARLELRRRMRGRVRSQIG